MNSWNRREIQHLILPLRETTVKLSFGVYILYIYIYIYMYMYIYIYIYLYIYIYIYVYIPIYLSIYLSLSLSIYIYSPPMCGSHWWVMHTQIHWWIPYIGAVHYVCGIPFQIFGNTSDNRNLFTHLGLAVLQKHLMDYR